MRALRFALGGAWVFKNQIVLFLMRAVFAKYFGRLGGGF
jgi:hypothetical protein